MLITIQETSAGVSLQQARRMTEEEQARFLPECRDRLLVSVGESVTLPSIGWEDLPDRAPDGEFVGEWNRAWILTQAEHDAFVALNAEREAEKERRKNAEYRAVYLEIIAQAERQGGAMTDAEAAEARKRYNDAYNEGGYGYVPHYVTRRELEAAKAWIEQHPEVQND